MKRNIRTLILFSLAALTIVACKKKDDDDATPTSSSKTTLLTANDWKFTNLKADPPYDTVDAWSAFPSCTKDDIITFNKNGNVMFDEGITKCEPTDPQTTTAEWVWLENETQLRWIDDDMDTTILINVTITETTLTGKDVFITLPVIGDVYATYTLSKK